MSWVDLAGYAIIALMVKEGTFKLPLEGDERLKANTGSQLKED